jgi:hypothetical protein
MALTKRYEKSMTTTLRRYVEHGPDHPMAMLISTPHWHIELGRESKQSRHFVRSNKFAECFSTVTGQELLASVDNNSRQRRGGPVADFIFPLNDDNGVRHEFHAECFYNRHDILTLCVQTQKYKAKRIVVPA